MIHQYFKTMRPQLMCPDERLRSAGFWLVRIDTNCQQAITSLRNPFLAVYIMNMALQRRPRDHRLIHCGAQS